MVSQITAGTAVAVTATSSGTLTSPGSQSNKGWVVVTNCSPWIATISDAEGTKTLQPYYQDVFIPPNGQSVNYTMSSPPGGSVTAPANQPVYLQGDWYVTPGDPPMADGTYPISLTAQALAAIAGTISASYTESVLTSGSMSSASVTLPAGTQALRILVPLGTTRPRVVGNTSSEPYPVLQQWGTAAASTVESVFICAVDSSVDAAVTVTFGGTVTADIVAINAPQQVSTYPANVGPSALAVPAFIGRVGGSDSAGNMNGLNVAVGGTASTGVVLGVGGNDNSGNAQILAVTAPGAAAPTEAQVVQAGSDGTNTHLLETDTKGGLLQGQVPNLQVAHWASNVAAAGTTSIVAAVGGKTITVYGIDGMLGAGAITVGTYIGQLSSITTAVIVAVQRTRILTAVGDSGPVKFGPLWIPGGFPLPIGEGLQFLAQAGNSANIDTAGCVYFTQL